MGGEARHVVCAAADLRPGERRLVQVRGRSIGLFNVDGRYYALHNGCPHKGGPLCEGRIGGTTLPTREHEFVYGREGCILRCAWHGWEFDIRTGQCIGDPTVKARTFPTSVENGEVFVHL